MPFTVIYDANALYPMSLRDLLVRIGQTVLVRARWTTEILDEWVDALTKARPELGSRLERTVRLMNESIRDVLVTGYEDLIPNLQLPDPDDRHVLAAAIRCGAQTIVTFNLEDFPKEVLATYGIEAQHPDEFVKHLIDLDRQAICGVLAEMAAEKTRPPMTVREVIESLRRARLAESADLLSTLCLAGIAK